MGFCWARTRGSLVLGHVSAVHMKDVQFTHKLPVIPASGRPDSFETVARVAGRGRKINGT